MIELLADQTWHALPIGEVERVLETDGARSLDQTWVDARLSGLATMVFVGLVGVIPRGMGVK